MFAYAFIVFLSLFLVLTNGGKICFHQIKIYIIQNITSNFSNISFFLFDNAAITCVTDDDCPKDLLPDYYKCIFKICVLIR